MLALGSEVLAGLQVEPAGGLLDALSESPILALGVLFSAGVLTSTNPCVWPMIPVTFSVISGTAPETQSRGRTLRLTLTYALGLALLYSMLGVVAGLGGTPLRGDRCQPMGAFRSGQPVFVFCARDVGCHLGPATSPDVGLGIEPRGRFLSGRFRDGRSLRCSHSSLWCSGIRGRADLGCSPAGRFDGIPVPIRFLDRDDRRTHSGGGVRGTDPETPAGGSLDGLGEKDGRDHHDRHSAVLPYAGWIQPLRRLMIRHTQRILLLGTMVIASGVGVAPLVAQAGTGQVSLAIGTPGPNPVVQDLEGGEVELHDYLEGRPAVLEFWASWCETVRRPTT